ncbi:MAG TPA: hypothetical protein VFJ19_08245 [Nocardioidaceae bacterium]|nr:hypothetical protein [Nocardioidaceae bacterium]
MAGEAGGDEGEESPREIDAFDLPDWVGTDHVTWTAMSSVHAGAHVQGRLEGTADERDGLPCDLLAVDRAYPRPVLDEKWRTRAHQAWTHGQVLLVEYDAQLTLAVPGTGFTADAVLEAVGRLAKAVGAAPDTFVVALRL